MGGGISQREEPGILGEDYKSIAMGREFPLLLSVSAMNVNPQ